MTPGNPLTELLRPYVKFLKADATRGNSRAKMVINLYRMYCARQEAGSATLCKAAFDEWKRGRETAVEEWLRTSQNSK